jgi:hypothetical protein
VSASGPPPPDRDDYTADPPSPDSAPAPAVEPGSELVAEPATPELDSEPAEPPPPPAPSPFARLPTRSSRLVAEAFDVLARSTGDLRRGSFYIGLLVVGTMAPFALLFWRIAVGSEEVPIIDEFGRVQGGLEGPVTASAVIALIGVLVAVVESRAVAATMLAARFEGSPIDLRHAVERSRTVFWRIVAATFLTSIPLLIVQRLTETLTKGLFRGESEVSIISAALLSTVLLAPFAYVVTGIVLGDVGPLESVRRSVRLFRARKLAACVVALFAWGAQLLTSFGLFAGLDLVIRAADAISLFSSTDVVATAVTAVALVTLVFAVGTLLFTVTAISLAPQVAMFLALTRVAPGLDAARAVPRDRMRRFRLITWPYLFLVVAGLLILFAGLRALGL